MQDLYTRLDEVGFPQRYVRDRILPDWWEDGLASDPGSRRIAELTISRTLRIPLAELVEPDARLSLWQEQEVWFKHWQGVERDKLLPAVAIARRVCELLLLAAPALPAQTLEGVAASDLSARILSRDEYVDLGNLLQASWDSGMPVVHLASLPQGAQRVDGMAFLVSGRPCIALASSKKSPAWLLWHLAHELGHVACGHVRSEGKLDVAIDFGSTQRDEQEANSFAHSLIHRDTQFTADWHITGESLAARARRLGPKHRVWPPCIVTSYGFNMMAWGTANKALSQLGAGSGGPEEVRSFLQERLDFDELSPTDRHFFAAVTGIPG